MVLVEAVGKREVPVGRAQSSALSWPAVLQGTGHAPGPPPRLHRSHRSREGCEIHVALHVLTCVCNRAAPGAKKERDFPDMVLSGLHQKRARDPQRTGTCRISCVSTEL